MTAEFRAGLVFGIVAASAVVAFSVILSGATRARRPLPIAGLAIVAGTILAIAARRSLPGELLVAIVGIGAVCGIGRARLAPGAATLCALPFALLLASTLDDQPGWLRVIVVLAASAGAVAVAETDELWRETGVTPLLLAISAVAVYLAVPDTEETAALLGVVLPVALLGWPLRVASLGRAGGGAATALVVWIVATDGRAAPPAVLGALACLALLLGLAAGHARRPAPATTGRGVEIVLAAVVIHGVLALVAARIGAAHADLTRAVVVASFVVGASCLAGAWLSPPRA